VTELGRRKRVHLAARLPESGELNFDSFVHLAQTAERGLFDFVLIAGRLTVLAALAAVTERIGLVGSVDTDSVEPFEVARQLATLDHLSGGRAGWHVAGTNPRADEFLEVADAFWDSWEPEAVVADVEGGVYAHADRIHAVEHHGEHFDVRGVATLPAGPQGRPVLLQNDRVVGGGALTASSERERRSAKSLHAVRLGRGAEPQQMADEIELRVQSGACDGFILIPQSGRDLDDFLSDVVPLLQESGCFRSRYDGFTLRDHLGL
jgi:alkanesulfonate monooxygenase SsuD/methylene tetrahydromethanopterin reductase-like flavin-dependent oxidoreductase (luciferase family)